MSLEIQNLPPEFVNYVENFWQEYGRLSKLIANNNNIKLYFKLEDVLNYHLENITPDDLAENLKDIVNKCSQLLKKVPDAERYRLQLESLETEYQSFMESCGVDLDDRTYDEDFYAFIHGIDDNN